MRTMEASASGKSTIESSFTCDVLSNGLGWLMRLDKLYQTPGSRWSEKLKQHLFNNKVLLDSSMTNCIDLHKEVLCKSGR